MSASVFSNRKPSEAGFTLVEIAIVLVIIGLLLGGILKGQEMINQARIKNAINDFNGVTVAVTSYQDRYRALPGDDGNADTRWSSLVPPPAKGSGDGVIDGNYNTAVTAAPTTAQETNLFWQHLRIAGFVPGITAGNGSGSQPMNAASGIVGVQTATTAGTPVGLGFTGPIICSSNIPDKVAIAVDTQMDDGNSATGQVRSQAQTGSNPALGATAASAYVETGVSQYLVCRPFS
jgi:prepilin-type N-terminal cleavage/methylation domain-containing protein